MFFEADIYYEGLTKKGGISNGSIIGYDVGSPCVGQYCITIHLNTEEKSISTGLYSEEKMKETVRELDKIIEKSK